MVAASHILVTGVAGFIGYHVARRLLENQTPVVGIDNLNSYYDPALKQARLAELAVYPDFKFIKLDLANRDGMAALFLEERFSSVVHLGAQAGIRYSLINPQSYIDSNLVGFGNILEGCRHAECEHLLYASSSSVFGGNTRLPFSIHDSVDHPLTLYAATKKSNELMAHSYSHVFGLPTTGLRFFTVYGPWGRPDMAMWLFADAIAAGRPIKLFNSGRMRRDFTYIDDVVTAVLRLISHVPKADPDWSSDKPSPASSSAPWRVYNIGNHDPVELLDVVRLLQEAIGAEAKCEFLQMQPGEVPATFADIEDLTREVGFKPSTSIADGICRFVDWFKAYHRLR